MFSSEKFQPKKPAKIASKSINNRSPRDKKLLSKKKNSSSIKLLEDVISASDTSVLIAEGDLHQDGYDFVYLKFSVI
jgi:hypothetical protein